MSHQKPPKISVVIAADNFLPAGQQLENHFNTELALIKFPLKSLISTSIESLLSWPECGKIFVLSKDQNILDVAKKETVDNPYYDSDACTVRFIKVNSQASNYGDILRHVEGRELSENDFHIDREMGDAFIFIRGPYVKFCADMKNAYDKQVERMRSAKKSGGATPAMTFLFKQCAHIDNISCFLYAESDPSYKILKLMNRQDQIRAACKRKYAKGGQGDSGDQNAMSITKDTILSELINIPITELNTKISSKNNKISYLTRTDLIESSISIVTKQICVSFSENPSWDDFGECLADILAQEEIYNNHCHYYIGKDFELEPLESVHMFKEILHRNLLSGKQTHTDMINYTHNNFNSYFHKSSKIYNTSLVTGTWCSQNTKTKSKTKITCSQIMENSKIGKNCILDNCYIGENVIIEDNCKMRNCFVVNGNKILEGTVKLNKILGECDMYLDEFNRDSGTCKEDGQENGQEEELVEEELLRFPKVIIPTRSRMTSLGDDYNSQMSDQMNSELDQENGDPNGYFLNSDDDSDDDDGSSIDNQSSYSEGEDVIGGEWSDDPDDLIDLNETNMCLETIKDLISKDLKNTDEGFNNLATEMRRERASYKTIPVRSMVRFTCRVLITKFDTAGIKVKVNKMLKRTLFSFDEDIKNVRSEILKGVEDATSGDCPGNPTTPGKDEYVKAAHLIKNFYDIDGAFDDEEGVKMIEEWFSEQENLKKNETWIKLVKWMKESMESSEEESDSESEEEESSSEEEGESEDSSESS